jgi:protein-S-isoprenylcysteine O-methyltransferase Ste14
MINTQFGAFVLFAGTAALWVMMELGLGWRTRRAKVVSPNPKSEIAINISTVIAVTAALLASSAAPAAEIRPAGLAFAAGVALMWGGIAIRASSAMSLGAFYTLELGIQPGQRVFSEGLYRWVRHPGYAGTLVALLGLGAALGNWYSVLAIACVLPALAVRIGIEEKMLKRALGAPYESYCRRTRWRLLPGVL